MDSVKQVKYDLKDRSYLPVIKKDALKFCQAANFNEKKTAELEIVITEIGTNLIKHAGGGEIIIRLYDTAVGKGVEILSIDSGPGMADPIRMQEDGVSTTNTLGQGLGAIRRLSDQFQLYSVPRWGTILLTRLVMPVSKPNGLSRWGVYPIVIPKPGETHCGDLFTYKTNPYFIKVMLADGLGHGILAQQAAEKAELAFQKSAFNTPHQILTDVHHQVKGSRGVVATVGVYDLTQKSWTFSGVGNIASRLTDAISSKTYVPFNGIVGVNIPKHLESQSVSSMGRLLILCSDGISSRWDIGKHSSAFRCDQSILSAIIYKDYARHSDDTSVVVVKTF